MERLLVLLDHHWLLALVSYTGFAVLVLALSYVLFASIERRLVRAGWFPQNYRLARRYFLPSLCFIVSVIAGLMPSAVDVPVRVAPTLIAAGKVGIIVSTMVILLLTINVGVDIMLRQLRTENRDNLRQRRLLTQIRYLEKIVDLMVIFVALSAVMLSFESFRRLGGSLLASAGLASVILGFSAQRSLGNLIAGFQIAFTQPIRFGDAVLVEGEWGEIEEITLTYVVVRIWDLRRLVLPITYFLEKPFQNWTRTSSALIGSVMLPVDYAMPIEPLREELMRVLKASKRWDGRVANLSVVDITDRTLTVRALMSAIDAGTAFDLRCEVREALVTFINDNYPECLPRTRIDALPAPGAASPADREWARQSETA